MRIYTAPGVSAYTVNGAHIETFVNLKPGSYSTVVQAWDSCGGVGKTTVDINVNSDTAVTVFMPNSPVGNIPNHIAASAQSPTCAAGINAMRIYTASGVAPYTVHSNHLNTFVNLLPGTYTFTLQAWDNCGKVIKFRFTQTVVGAEDGYLYAPIGTTNGYISEFLINNGVLKNPNGTGAPPKFPTPYDSPNYLAADPGGWFVYALSVAGIDAYQVNQSNGALMPIPGSPFNANGAASDIATDSNGNFVFICDKNLNAILVYRIDRSSGALTKTTTVQASGNFNGLAAVSTDFSGQYLYAVNQNYNSVQVFGYKINLDTGTVSAVPGSPYHVANSVTPNTGYGFALQAVADYLYVGTQTGTGQAFGYTVNFGNGALTPIHTSSAWLLDEVPANPQALLVDNQARFLWAPGSAPSPNPGNWFTEYHILSGGDVGVATEMDNGSLLTAAMLEDGSGQYLYAHGYNQACSGTCPSVVSSYSISSSGNLVRISGPLSTGGSAATALNEGIAVVRKYGD